MAIGVQFFTFSKKLNSTARPSGGSQASCLLKEPCGVLNPKLQLQWTNPAYNPSVWNMAYIPDFRRYYYIDEWTYFESIWTASLSVDPLATWKDDIGDSSCYILRSSNTYMGAITDSLYPTLATPVQTLTTISDVGFRNYGVYIIGVCTQINGVGPVTYYAMTPSQLEAMGASLWDGITTSLGIIHPLDYISSLRWFPFASPSAVQTTFKLGIFGAEHSALYMNESDFLYTESTLIELPEHPQNLIDIKKRSFLELPPYTNHRFEWYPFGTVDIKLPAAYTNHLLDVRLDVDFTTGDGLVTLSRQVGTSEDVQFLSAKVGVDIAIGHQTVQATGLLNAIVDTVQNVNAELAEGDTEYSKEMRQAAKLKTESAQEKHRAAAEGAVDAAMVRAVGAGGAGIVSAISKLHSRADIQGYPTGRFIQFEQHRHPRVITTHQYVAEEANEEYGRPLCKTKTISDIPGYIKCADADIKFAGTPEEISSVKSFMDSGFFYE